MDTEILNEEELKDIRRAFSIFIKKVIVHSAINYAKKEKIFLSRFVSLDYFEKKMSLSVYEDDIFSLSENIKSINIEDIMTDKNKREIVAKLSKREKEIIYLMYVEEKTSEEISFILNLSIKTVLNTKNNALNKLRKELRN